MSNPKTIRSTTGKRLLALNKTTLRHLNERWLHGIGGGREKDPTDQSSTCVNSCTSSGPNQIQ